MLLELLSPVNLEIFVCALGRLLYSNTPLTEAITTTLISHHLEPSKCPVESTVQAQFNPSSKD